MDPRPEVPAPQPPVRHNYLLHAGLFLATLITTTKVGMEAAGDALAGSTAAHVLAWIGSGLPYSLSIMGILLTHEMGHFLLARYHGVPASLPYFIPIPLFPIGTMGAVIRMRGQVNSKSAMVDIGAAGPLAGLVVALPVLAIGLHLSPVGPASGMALQEGNSLLYLLMKLVIKGAVLPGNGLDVHLHPMAWAGWVGLLVTMLNLMPVGQLDGGHVAYAYFGKRHDIISTWLHRGLIPLAMVTSAYSVLERLATEAPRVALALGWNGGMPWMVWFVLLAVMKRLSGGQYHPEVGGGPVTPGRRRLCLVMLIIFALIFIPIPLRLTMGAGG